MNADYTLFCDRTSHGRAAVDKNQIGPDVLTMSIPYGLLIQF